MANSSRTRRGTSSRARSNRTRRSSSRTRNSSQRNRTAPSATTHSRKGTLTRPDTGYSLRSRRVRRDYSNNPLAVLLRPRVLLFVLVVSVVVLVLVFGVGSCIRRDNEAKKQQTEEVRPKNEQDARVAAGVSATMTSKFTEALDEGEQLAQIAKNADKYVTESEQRLLTLALNEPSAIAFVAAYPTSDKASRPYEGNLARGDVPCLYNWDAHWGAVTYNGGPLAVTGSGPTTLAMAYMGLTGKTDYSPTEIAQQAGKSNYAGGDSGSKAELFSRLAFTMGLTSEALTPAADTLRYSLGDNTVIAVELREGTLTDDAHWALVVNVNADGSVTVFDPTSTAVSARPWDAGTIAQASSDCYALKASEETLAGLQSSEGSDTGADTDATTTAEDSDTTDY